MERERSSSIVVLILLGGKVALCCQCPPENKYECISRLSGVDRKISECTKTTFSLHSVKAAPVKRKFYPPQGRLVGGQDISHRTDQSLCSTATKLRLLVVVGLG